MATAAISRLWIFVAQYKHSKSLDATNEDYKNCTYIVDSP